MIWWLGSRVCRVWGVSQLFGLVFRDLGVRLGAPIWGFEFWVLKCAWC